MYAVFSQFIYEFLHLLRAFVSNVGFTNSKHEKKIFVLFILVHLQCT